MTASLNLTPEEYRKHEQVLQNKSRKKLHANWSPEQWAEYKRKAAIHWENWKKRQTPERLKEIHDKAAANRRKKYANMSPEERAEVLRKHHERTVSQRANMTPEQKEKEAIRGRERMFGYKIKVLNHYSDGAMRCMNTNCEVPGGAKNIRALCIDHINGGGHQETLRIQREGMHFYGWLIKHNFPPGYQVLCASCNQIKKVEQKEGCKERYKNYK
jgi:hypothetical protein